MAGKRKHNGGGGSYGSEYYESGSMPEAHAGRRKARKINPKYLGTGLARGAANKMLARKRYLEGL